jgi:small-conductance mechanosensitive channel
MELRSFFAEIQEDWGLLGTLLIVLGAMINGFILHKVVFNTLERWSKKASKPLLPLLHEYLYRPTQLVLLTLSVIATLPFLGMEYYIVVNHAFSIILIATFTYLLIQVIGLMRELLIKRYDVNVEDNLRARKVYTQFRIIERVLVFIIIIFAIAVALMTFEKIRQVGVSLLASAGILGIIIGFAAQRSLGTILAGIQIAISQPIRMDDVVIVEGEWGRIEEINLTYVVVKIWDERRMVVPINYFIEKPFQSWTRASSELIGSVFFYLDYTAPMEEMRKELDRLLTETDLWDGRVSVMQVTETTEKSMQVRVLVSSSNSGKTYDLRCFVRERMITFLQKNYPQSLPRTRINVEQPVLINQDDSNG